MTVLLLYFTLGWSKSVAMSSSAAVGLRAQLVVATRGTSHATGVPRTTCVVHQGLAMVQYSALYEGASQKCTIHTTRGCACLHERNIAVAITARVVHQFSMVRSSMHRHSRTSQMHT
eukprot:jgi/Ulvmu1/7540/UM037_0084.1